MTRVSGMSDPPRLSSDRSAPADSSVRALPARVDADRPIAAQRPRFQYSLRTLMLTISGLSALFAAMSAVGPVWSLLLGWCVVLIAAHIAGNVWGTRAREQKLPPLPEDAPATRRPQHAPPAAFAPATHLGQRTGPGLAMVTLTCLGAAAGGALGSYLLWKARSDLVFLVGYVVGVSSASIVGGFVCYLGGSFLEIALQAWRQASRNPEEIPGKTRSKPEQ